MNKISSKYPISRRTFLTTAGGLGIAISAYACFPSTDYESVEDPDTADLEERLINSWVYLRADGQITIYSPAAEMGQGSFTALPIILAEEMDADWSKVKVVQAPAEPEIFGSPGWRRDTKIMINVGSRTVMSYFQLLRKAGAQIRRILLDNVAAHWKVPVSELETAPSMVLHPDSDRQIAYGDILAFFEAPDDIPEIKKEDLKDPADFRLIGANLPRVEIPSKVDGSAQFALDVQLPNMLYGVIERGNLHDSKPTLLNEQSIRTIDGLMKIVPFDYGIGVIATSLEKALAIKKELQIHWDENVPAISHNSETIYKQYGVIAGNNKQEKDVLTNKGDFSRALRSASKTYTSDYKNDYVYHAQMEPLNAVASVSEDGKSAEIWLGTQNPGSAAPSIAKALGIKPEDVQVNLCYLGGGLGRRSLHDYPIEAALLSKAVGRPVKLLWTREDDLRYGMYRPLSLQRMQATVDAKGKITGLSHTIVGDGSRLLASGAKNEFYDIPNQHVELRSVKNGIRLKHWRAVGHGPNKFAIESFLDEIAIDQQIDPLQLRRILMKDQPRAVQTLEKAAEMANWTSPAPKGRARGIAFGERSGALCTGICEISLDEKSGQIRVHHFWAAVDAGIIIQPDNVIAQMEGGIIMGMSSVFKERVSIEKGRIQESNFHDYQLLRMEDVPESIEIAMIPSVGPPRGIGEASTPVVAGAIANAFAALTGKRLRHLPFTKERVKKVLES